MSCCKDTLIWNTGTNVAPNGQFLTYGTLKSIESYAQIVMIDNFTVQNLFVTLQRAPGLGNSRTFTVRKNGVDQALAVTVADNAISGFDTTDSFTVAPLDLISVIETSSGTPNTGAAAVSAGLY